jgi:hypothetical protein
MTEIMEMPEQWKGSYGSLFCSSAKKEPCILRTAKALGKIVFKNGIFLLAWKLHCYG